jgi:hypothetical protein
VAYDTKTVLDRYQQLEDLPEGEPSESDCAILNKGTCSTGSTCLLDDCRSCCVGVVEVVRRVHAQQVEIEKRAVTFDDMLTQASALERHKA